MLENSEVKLWGKKSGGPAQLRQLWKIQHVERDYYSIRSAYRHDLALFADGTNIKMATLDTALTPEETPLNLQWRISRDVNSFVIQYVGTSSLTLRPAEGTLSPGTDLTVANVTPTNSYTWTLGWKTVEDQLLLLNTQLGLPAQNAVRTVTIGSTVSLEDMNLAVSFVSRTTNDQTVNWSSQYHWFAAYDKTTKYFTAKAVGTTIITASNNNASNTVSFTIVVIPPTNPDIVANLDVLYDNGFVTRYADPANRMNEQLAGLQGFFWKEFGIFVNYSTPTLFTSYADTCSTNPLEACTHSEVCESSYYASYDELILKEYHHKNFDNILVRIPLPDMTETLRLAYIGHNVCEPGNQQCERGAFGLAFPSLGVAAVSYSGYVEGSTKVTIHEFGHFYGAPDHYGEEKWEIPTTEEMNEKTGSNLYSENCMYGENGWALEDLFTLCEGCRKTIQDNLEKFNHAFDK